MSARVTVDAREIVFEGLAVELDKVVGQREANQSVPRLRCWEWKKGA
jgi:hypothetical protein